MGVISWIIFGFVVGLLARAITPGRQKMGFIPTIVLGIVGGLVAGFVGHALGFYATDSGAGIIASIIGAIVVLWAYNAVMRRRAPAVPGSMTRDKLDRTDRTGRAA